MILSINIFRFQDKYYLQKQGTAMGTRMAPSYANLFMGLFETNFLSSKSLKPLAWFRFIDDIFFIWQHGLESLIHFLEKLNTFSNLKFTWKYSSEMINFLDVNIFIQSGHLETKLLIEESNTMQYLHYDSCHSTYIKNSIPKSLEERARKLCSKEEDFKSYTNTLTEAFKNPGYPEKGLKTIQKNVKTKKS